MTEPQKIQAFLYISIYGRQNVHLNLLCLLGAGMFAVLPNLVLLRAYQAGRDFVVCTTRLCDKRMNTNNIHTA